jgi:SagB-type dehydrogenase family enzyme
MKKMIIHILLVIMTGSLFAQDTETIVLNPPDKERGLPFMEAMSLRASVTEFDAIPLKLQDLSDLLWAANGINRPDEGKRTAPSAMNAQDIDIYVLMESGIYFYDPKEYLLQPVVDGDHRMLVASRQVEVAEAPVICLLVSDISRFRAGEDSLKLVWAAMDAGIVSQNINIFCAATGLTTRPRATMDQEKLREILELKDSQHLMLNNPVSYRKE